MKALAVVAFLARAPPISFALLQGVALGCGGADTDLLDVDPPGVCPVAEGSCDPDPPVLSLVPEGAPARPPHPLSTTDDGKPAPDAAPVEPPPRG